MKNFFIIIIILFILGIGGLISAFVWWNSASSAPANSDQLVTVLITKGSSAEAIGKKLSDSGTIKSPFAFKLYIQYKNLTTKLPVGEFNLPVNLPLSDLVDELLSGPTEYWVTIPEGLRREEVAQKISEQLDLPDSSTFIKQFLLESENYEGFLFPDTYLFPSDATASLVVAKLVSTFEQKYNQLQVNTNLSKLDIVTLASIIERETLNTAERELVAGILMNRYNADWPLQADATVQYAVANFQCSSTDVDCDWWPRPLTLGDLEVTSPYNTYKYPGFPPGPISNPGLSALKAAANPESSDYWFYLHDDEGNIYYAKTLEGHNANIRNYLNK